MTGRWFALAVAAVAVAAASACSSSDRSRPARPPAPLDAAAPADAPAIDAAPVGIDSLRLRVREAGIELVTATAGETYRDSTSCTSPWAEAGGVRFRVGCRRCDLAAVDPDPAPDELWGFGFALHETPPAMLAAAGLRRVVLCTAISRASDDEAIIGGTTDAPAGELWLTVTPGEYQDRGWLVFHHELFHLFERNAASAHWLDDLAWTRLGSGHVSAYARKNHREDRAETYARFVGQGIDSCSMFGRDRSVMAKARLIRDRVAAVIGGDAAYIEGAAPCLHEPDAVPPP